MTGIYKITNLVNGKSYIGQSVSISERWRAHRHRPFNSNSKQYNSPLYRAIRKYGLQNFKFEVLEQCEKDCLDKKEIAYIKYYNTTNPDFGYNLTSGGSGNASTDANSILSTEQVFEIYDLLANTNLSEQEIADKYKVSQRMISGINIGQYKVQESIAYPIRRRKVSQSRKNYCIDCGIEITLGSTRCRKCNSLNKTTMPQVSREELKRLIRTTPFTKIGKQFGVSDNAVRKRCDKYNLPRKVNEIKKISNEDWSKI